MNDILTILGSNTLVAILSYLTGRKRSNAETDNQILRNLELSVNLYKEIIDNLKEEIEGLNRKIQALETKIEELIKENHQLKANL